MSIYCIEVTTEFAEDGFVMHREFESEPTRDMVLKEVMSECESYDDNYGKLNYYEVKAKPAKQEEQKGKP